jgi:hypothetical protein
MFCGYYYYLPFRWFSWWIRIGLVGFPRKKLYKYPMIGIPVFVYKFFDPENRSRLVIGGIARKYRSNTILL